MDHGAVMDRAVCHVEWEQRREQDLVTAHFQLITEKTVQSSALRDKAQNAAASPVEV